MKDMFGDLVRPSSRRGDHEFLSNYFDDDKDTYKVMRVRGKDFTEYIVREVHPTGVRYAVNSKQGWKNAEKYRELTGMKRHKVYEYKLRED